MSEITRFDVYGRANYSNDGSLVLYDHHKEIISDLERQLAEAREDVKKAVKQGFDAMCDGGFCPITFDEFWARSEFNRLKEKGDELHR